MDSVAYLFPAPVIQHPHSNAAGQQNSYVNIRSHIGHVVYLDLQQQRRLPQTLETSLTSSDTDRQHLDIPSVGPTTLQ